MPTLTLAWRTVNKWQMSPEAWYSFLIFWENMFLIFSYSKKNIFKRSLHITEQTSNIKPKIPTFSFDSKNLKIYYYACKTVAIIRIQQQKAEWKEGHINKTHVQWFGNSQPGTLVFSLSFSFDERALFRLLWHWPDPWFPFQKVSR